jgi:eukaryotic-like serine/threonine-protein kinase
VPVAIDSTSRAATASEHETLLAPALSPSTTHERVKQPGEPPESAPEGRDTDKYIGRTIDGRYVVESVLGEGGMGVVYKCRRKVFDKAVAIKILRSDVAKNPEVLDRFVTEAKAASAIGNAHIVDVFDFGEVPDGSTYFAMEYLDGDTLGALIARDALSDPARVVSIGGQMAEGLAAAHAEDIVHRDLKPDNVFITLRDGDDFVKILDFGIAKVAGLQSKITRAGAVFGTPHYMSPEQCRGTSVDFRTDVYSLGVLLYEMVTGRVPFDAENPLTILSMHMNAPPQRFVDLDPPPESLPGLEAVILKCLAKHPDERFQSMDEVEQALAAIARGETVEIEVPISVAPPVDEEAPVPVVPPAPSAPALAPPSPRQRPDESGRLSYVGDVRPSIPGGAAPPSPRGPVSSRFELDLEAAARDAEEEREWANRRNARKWPLVGGLFLIAAGLAGAAFTMGSLQVDTMDEAVQAGRPLVLGEYVTKRAPAVGKLKKTALVLSPIDAHVFLDGRDLGTMPVEVEIKQGESASVEVKKKGYWTRRVKLDGSEQKVTVRLSPITAAAGSGKPNAGRVPPKPGLKDAPPVSNPPDEESAE